ncbi:DMT family transporter [Gemmiger formicilis]|uniref:DMT family transporter n=1 Tax=Gemmiger formicilis TaxID=745368 RepID=UPI00195A36C0|nr:DMT family transporter [Gemmiger formicilis]MBM6717211.1 DMT family transporter [Gemmiger formicilis]
MHHPTLDRTQLRNTLLLVLGALIWGVAFVAQSVGSGYVGAYTFLAARSWLACAFLLGLIFVRHKTRQKQGSRLPFWIKPKTLVLGGALCGIALFAASAAQQMGVGTTSTAKAGFLTALYVVIVPVLGLFAGRRPGAKLWVCVAVSVVGLYLLCMAGRDALTLTGGEWQLLLCALLFSFQIMLVDHFGPQLDGVQLSFAEFLMTAVLSTLFMFLFENPTPAQLAGAAVSILYCGILSSGVGYTLQILGQQNLDPTIASLAMCLESVFSALAGWVVLHQTLTPVETLGCCLMFAAIVGAQLPGRKPAAEKTAEASQAKTAAQPASRS